MPLDFKLLKCGEDGRKVLPAFRYQRRSILDDSVHYVIQPNDIVTLWAT